MVAAITCFDFVTLKSCKMETIFRINVLKENFNRSDIHLKCLLKEIWDCDIDSQRLNQINGIACSTINQIREDLVALKQLADSIENEEQWKEMQEQYENMNNQFNTTVLTLRKAISSNQNVINQRTRNKLFERSSNLRNRLEESMNGGKFQQNTDGMATKAADLTGNLQSVSRMLANEVEKSKLNLDTLTTSSATVTETSQEFKVMSNYISNSKTLLSKYGRRELTDKILTILAFSFFFGCVMYVISKRIYYR